MFQRYWRHILVTLTTLACAGPVLGQEVLPLRFQQPPYYVGEPVVIQIVAKGFNGKAEPQVKLAAPLPEGVSIAGPQVNRSMSRFMQMDFGGRTTVQESVNYTFQFVVTAAAAGDFDIGPFEVSSDGQTQTVAGKVFHFQELQDDADMELSASLPQSSLYLGQRVPVTIRWAMSAPFYEIDYAFRNLEIRSPLFDQFDLIETRQTTRTALSIATANGTVSVDAEQSQERRDGREFITLSSTVLLVPTTVGEFDSLAVTCRTERGDGWQRGLFGRFQPQRSRPARATGRVQPFTVKPLPQEGRPASFAGAVGAGYAIDVSANRTVVRVGDPISLTLSLRGQGLEKMPLPDLTADGGLSPDRFQLPSEPPPGNYDGRVKQFKLNVRVKEEAVDKIPALAYSWFDPEKEAYVTARSKPIALQVLPGQVLDAEDVISALPATREETSAPRPVAASGGQDVARGANLAIEKDLQQLTSGTAGWLTSSLLQPIAYVLGVSVIVLATLVRRRAEVDPAIAARRAKIQACRAQVKQASRHSGKESVQQLADGLRKLIPIADDETRPPLDALIAQCEVAIYAPQDSGAWADIARQAQQLVDRIDA